MKRFAVFCGYKFYPSKAWDDFSGAFDTLEQAKDKGLEFIRENESYCWIQVVDLMSLEEVFRKEVEYEG